MLIIALAAAALTPQRTMDINCVAALGIVANEQAQGRRRDLPPLRDDGAEFAAIVGAGVMDETGETREAVRDLIVAEATRLTRAGAISRSDVARCVVRMNAVLAKPVSAPAAPLSLQ